MKLPSVPVLLTLLSTNACIKPSTPSDVAAATTHQETTHEQVTGVIAPDLPAPFEKDPTYAPPAPATTPKINLELPTQRCTTKGWMFMDDIRIPGGTGITNSWQRIKALTRKRSISDLDGDFSILVGPGSVVEFTGASAAAETSIMTPDMTEETTQPSIAYQAMLLNPNLEANPETALSETPFWVDQSVVAADCPKVWTVYSQQQE